VLLLSLKVLSPAGLSPAAYAAVLGASVLFGTGDSILESQLPSLVQSPSFFPRERDRDAANSNVRMWQSLGFTLQFGLSALGVTPLTQAYVLVPLGACAYAGLAVCDGWVQELDASKGSLE